MQWQRSHQLPFSHQQPSSYGYIPDAGKLSSSARVLMATSWSLRYWLTRFALLACAIPTCEIQFYAQIRLTPSTISNNNNKLTNTITMATTTITKREIVKVLVTVTTKASVAAWQASKCQVTKFMTGCERSTSWRECIYPHQYTSTPRHVARHLRPQRSRPRRVGVVAVTKWTTECNTRALHVHVCVFVCV